jgi:hypothetical protein
MAEASTKLEAGDVVLGYEIWTLDGSDMLDEGHPSVCRRLRAFVALRSGWGGR